MVGEALLVSGDSRSSNSQLTAGQGAGAFRKCVQLFSSRPLQKLNSLVDIAFQKTPAESLSCKAFLKCITFDPASLALS